MHHAMPATVDIPETITDYEPVSYDLFVSGDYEVRVHVSEHVMKSYQASQHRSDFSAILATKGKKYPK